MIISVILLIVVRIIKLDISLVHCNDNICYTSHCCLSWTHHLCIVMIISVILLVVVCWTYHLCIVMIISVILLIVVCIIKLDTSLVHCNDNICYTSHCCLYY